MSDAHAAVNNSINAALDRRIAQYRLHHVESPGPMGFVSAATT